MTEALSEKQQEKLNEIHRKWAQRMPPVELDAEVTEIKRDTEWLPGSADAVGWRVTLSFPGGAYMFTVPENPPHVGTHYLVHITDESCPDRELTRSLNKLNEE